MTEREALKLALDYIVATNKSSEFWLIPASNLNKTVTAIKEALREHAMYEVQRLGQEIQPEQEPVAWMSEHRFDELRKGFTVMTTLTKQRVFEDDVAIYTTPPQRKPLTDEMRKQMKERCDSMEMRGAFVDGWLSAEAAHGIKENT